MTWQVSVPAGRWMGGYVHHFKTKAKALAFIDRWNTVEVNSGNKSVRFHRSGPTAYAPVAEAPWPLIEAAKAEKAQHEAADH